MLSQVANSLRRASVSKPANLGMCPHMLGICGCPQHRRLNIAKMNVLSPIVTKAMSPVFGSPVVTAAALLSPQATNTLVSSPSNGSLSDPNHGSFRNSSHHGTLQQTHMFSTQNVGSNLKPSHNVLDRLNKGETIIGDGGFVFALEKRGYVKAGPWTPEATMEHPEGVIQLHREFVMAGADVMQTFTFYASDDKLSNRGNEASAKFTCKSINEAACDIARKVANEGTNVMVAGGISQTPTYLSQGTKAEVQACFDDQLKVFTGKGVDFLIAEYYEHIEECEWAIESCLKTGLPVAANMCIGPEGDLHGNSVEECTRRMVEAGAHIVGVNCHFDPFVSLDAMKKVKAQLVKMDRFEDGPNKVHMMVQPLGYMTPDANKQGFIDLPEFPFALEPRVCTRFEMQAFARQAHELGIGYIGGCCGFEPYHIRAVSEELAQERQRRPPGNKWIPGAGGLEMHTKPWVRARASMEYWQNLKPAFGRVGNPAVSKPDGWKVTQGNEMLRQKKDATETTEIQDLQAIQTENRKANESGS